MRYDSVLQNFSINTKKSCFVAYGKYRLFLQNDGKRTEGAFCIRAETRNRNYLSLYISFTFKVIDRFVLLSSDNNFFFNCNFLLQQS